MIRSILVIIAFLMCFSMAYSGVVVLNFSHKVSVNKVELKWTVNSEVNIEEYQVLRSVNGSSFSVIGTKKVKSGDGEKSYKFVDDSVFKANNHIFYYKLQYVELVNGKKEIKGYDTVINVTPQISSAGRQTWGSIKAMFR